MRLQGRRILVTGAAGGLGSALVARLLADGAEVIATDVARDKLDTLERGLADTAGLRAEVIDQSRPEAAREAVAALIDAHGPVDSLVNNAAIYPKSAAAALPLDELRAVLDVNAVAAAALMQAVAPGMRAAGFGRIVNIASITFALGFAELAAYVASKGALIGMARVWARELGPDGITVNAVSPGAFQTDAEAIHDDPEGYSRFVIDRQAIKRRGQPAEFAHLVAFLLDRDSGMITGQNITVDGGWTMQ